MMILPWLLTVLSSGTFLSGYPAPSTANIVGNLTPQPQRLSLGEGFMPLRRISLVLTVPAGPEHEGCRAVLEETLRSVGATRQIHLGGKDWGNRFSLGTACPVPPPPVKGHAREAYSLAITPNGAAAEAASPAGLLYAAQTLRQVARLFATQGSLPAMTIEDYPEFKTRGMYIEGGQERFGRIVDKDYLREQIRRLAEFKMNTLIVECYNLFPLASFPACADAGTLSAEDCRALVAEARRYHVTIVPSLQTLAQSSELVWNCSAGKPYREATAPGQICPSTPEIYPFIKGLYRDLLQWFDTSPLLGIGCSEIEMQWQGRYCPRCQGRLKAGETVRDLLLGHAEKCIRAVHEIGEERRRPVRPLIWADEFYMYGPGKDWVGIERLPRDSVMGFWKYWADYKGIGGLLERGYDVLGISAMYNHTFYLADLSPEVPRKIFPAMEQTGTRNITQMVQEAAASRGLGKKESKSPKPNDPEFWGTATASFSKHRLRAFDSIWFGFVLNGHCTWSHSGQPLKDYQGAFTRAFVRHYYDCRTDASAEALASAWTRLDECKSQLELANQRLHDVIGVYDTQEPGYQDNTLMGALARCRDLLVKSGGGQESLAKIRTAARTIQETGREVRITLEKQRPFLGNKQELDDLLLAGEKIAAHAEREVLLIDTQRLLLQAPHLPFSAAKVQAAREAQRWRTHRTRLEAIAARDARLYRTGDPCGHSALLRAIETVEAHLFNLTKEKIALPPG